MITSRLLPGALLLVLVAGCGGGDDGGTASPAPTSASASATPSTSPTPSREPAEPRSEAAVVTAADLGPGWAEASAAAGAEPAAPTSCLLKSGAYEALVPGGRVAGAGLRRNENADNVGLSSVGITLETEQAALAVLDIMRSQAYQTCQTETFGATEREAQPDTPGVAYRVDDVADAEGQGDNGFELQISYRFQATVDGTTQDANGYKAEIVYRQGRTLLVMRHEQRSADGDAEDLETRINAEIVAAAAAAMKRVEALG